MLSELIENRFTCDGENLDSCLKEYSKYLKHLVTELADHSNIPDEIPLSDEDIKYLRLDSDFREFLWDIYGLSKDIANDFIEKIEEGKYLPETKHHILEAQLTSATFNFYELDNFSEETRKNTLSGSYKLRSELVVKLLNYLDMTFFLKSSKIPEDMDIDLQSLIFITLEPIPLKQKLIKFIEACKELDLNSEQIFNLVKNIRKFLSSMANVLSNNTEFFVDLFPNALTIMDAPFAFIQVNLSS